MNEAAKNPIFDEFASKHKVSDVFEITVNDAENKPVVAYFKKPSRQILSRSLSMQDRDPLAAKELILRNCYLEGDTRIMDDDDMFYSACLVVDSMIQYKRAIIKKN